MDRADFWQMQQDIEAEEHEAVEALRAVAKAGLVAEAAILARASGIALRRILPARPRDVAHIQFP